MGLSFVEINGVSQGGDNDAGHSALNNAAKPEQSPDTSIPTIDSTTKNQSLTKSLTPNTTATATEKKTKPKPKEADKKIFDGVIAVVSGIGKERADIRNKLQSLGGEYRPDWTDDATHLICASAGTPKFTQAKDSSAYIVHPEWVYDSFSNQKKMDESPYSLEKPHTPKTASDPNPKAKKPKKIRDDGVIDSDDDGLPNEYDLTDSFIDSSEDFGYTSKIRKPEKEKNSTKISTKPLIPT